jgi:hypothetical protein
MDLSGFNKREHLLTVSDLHSKMEYMKIPKKYLLKCSVHRHEFIPRKEEDE